MVHIPKELRDGIRRLWFEVLEDALRKDEELTPLPGNPAPRRAGRVDPRATRKCPKCGRRFVNLRGVEVHLARMHKATP